MHNNRVGVLLELRAETDFVVRGELFHELAHNVALHVAAMAPQSVAELLQQLYVRDQAQTIEQLIKSVVARVGENIQVERFCRYEL